MGYFRFPPTQDPACCCNPCGHIVDYDAAQPSSYTVTLSGVSFQQYTGHNCNGWGPPTWCNCGNEGFWIFNWVLDGTYVLDACAHWNTTGTYGCYSGCGTLASPASSWIGWFALPASVSSLPCGGGCTPCGHCSPTTSAVACFTLVMQLQLFLPPCVTDPSAPIQATWQLDLWPAWWFQEIFSSTIYVPPCCPGPGGQIGSANDYRFIGYSTFTPTLLPGGHVQGVAPLPSSWSVPPGWTEPCYPNAAPSITCSGATLACPGFFSTSQFSVS